MLRTKHGSAAVEAVYVLMFFLAIAAVFHRFAGMALHSRMLAVSLQNGFDQKAAAAGRPPCIEKLGDYWTDGRHKQSVFGAQAKRLIHLTRPVCK